MAADTVVAIGLRGVLPADELTKVFDDAVHPAAQGATA
jgi:hypothetical protein